MTIAQGSATTPGKDRMEIDRAAISKEYYHEQNLDRYRVVYMPAFIRAGVSSTIPGFKADWYSWIDVDGSATSDDYKANISISSRPVKFITDEWGTDPEDRSAMMVPHTRNSGITIQHTETLTGPTLGTLAWGQGTNAAGESPPIFSGAKVGSVGGNQRLPKQLEDQYGPVESYMETFGFIRFIVRSTHEGDTEPTDYTANIFAIHLEEDSEGGDEFPAILGEFPFGNSVDTIYHESMPVSSYLLRFANAMLDRYSKEARYNQTVVMGELYDIRTYVSPVVGNV